MHKAWKIFFIVLILSVFICSAFIVSATPSYIVSLKDQIELFSIGNDYGFSVVDEETLKLLIQEDMVEWYEEDVEVSLMGEIPVKYEDTLKDECYSEQWGTKTVKAVSSWEKKCYGEGIRIAVIDSGVSYHSELDGNVLDGYNYLDDNQDVTDENGHGTFVAGIIASKINEDGIIGVAPKAKIVPLKCFGTGRSTPVSVICKAIYDAVDVHKCQIINMSLGGEKNSTLMEKAVAYAINKGCIVVSSVGNSGSQTLFFPAAYEDVIGVGAVNKEKAHSTFSQVNESVFVVAPGEDIISTSLDGGYSKGKGTSFSAPYVSGIIALLLDAKEDATPAYIKSVLSQKSLDLGDEGYDCKYGYGFVDVSLYMDLILKESDLFISPMSIKDNEFHMTVFNNTDGEYNGYLIIGNYNGGIFVTAKIIQLKIEPKGYESFQDKLPKGSTKCFVFKDLDSISSCGNVRQAEYVENNIQQEGEKQ